jgi:DNA-directed RNA polymerase
MLDGVHYPVKVHKRGLFANLTHSIDAYVLRCVVKALRAAGKPFLLKHDDYIVPPSALHIVKKAAQEAFNTLYEVNVYQSALEEIAQHSPYELVIPTLYKGKARNTAGASQNFLMP